MGFLARALGKLLRVPADCWRLFVTYLPGPVGDALRYRYWKRRLRVLGVGTRIDVGVHFENPAWVSIGERCWIDRHVLVLAGPPRPGRVTQVKANERFRATPGEVVIGARTHVAPNVVISGLGGVQIGERCGIASGAAIYSYSHHYRAAGVPGDARQFAFTPLAEDAEQSMISGPVVVDDWCAVGLHAVLLPGASLGRGTWVASGVVSAGVFAAQTLVHQQVPVVGKPLGGLAIPAAPVRSEAAAEAR